MRWRSTKRSWALGSSCHADPHAQVPYVAAQRDSRAPRRMAKCTDMDGVLVPRSPDARRGEFLARLPELVRARSWSSPTTRSTPAGPRRPSGAAAWRCPRSRSGPRRSRPPIPPRPAAGRVRVRGRRGGPHHRAARSGLHITERAPEYVILGETRTYSFELITQAIRLIAGARASSPRTPTSGPGARARCRPPGRWRRRRAAPPGPPTTPASPIR